MIQYTWGHYLLLNPNLDLTQINNIIDTYVQIMNKHGSFISKEIWGERNLAYPIEKNKKTYRRAYYIMFLFKSTTKFASTLHDLDELNPNVLKQISVKKDYI